MLREERRIIIKRGDTESIPFKFYDIDPGDVVDLRFGVKKTYNSPYLLMISKADVPEAWQIDNASGTGTLFLNRRDMPDWSSTKNFYIDDSGTSSYFYEIQAVTTKQVATLLGINLTVVADVVTFDGAGEVSHFVTSPTADLQVLEGAAFAIVSAFLNANNPSGTNPVATAEDLKNKLAVASTIEFQIETLTDDHLQARSISLKKTLKGTGLLFIGGVQVLVPGEAYNFENNKVTWGDYLATRLEKGWTILLVYQSDPLS